MNSSTDTVSRYRDLSSKASMTQTNIVQTTTFNKLTGIPKQLKKVITSEVDHLVGSLFNINAITLKF